MDSFLVLSIIGVVYVFGYLVLGGNDATLYFGIAFWVIGSLLAILKDFQLARELKSLRKHNIETSRLMREYCDPLIYAEFNDPVAAQLFAEREIRKGYRADMKVKGYDKITVKIYKEKEDNEKESNK